ncbi:MAG: hypothetical protein ACOC56_03915 [Atribacterota bacterium]
MINTKKQTIELNIYYRQDDNKEVFINEEGIKKDLEEDLKKLIEKPEKYLIVEI